MNPERLLQNFDRLIDTPDAVPRLRRFILDLAVRGKLVEQNPEDEPAGELLKRIEGEKTRLFKAGKSRKENSQQRIDEETVLFSIPASWEWTAIRQITTDRGQKVPDKKFSYIDVSAIDKERGKISQPQILTPDAAPSRARKIVQKGDVIYSCVRPYLLNIAVVDEEFKPAPIVSTAFAVLNGLGLVLPRYLWIVLRSPYFVTFVEEKMRGQAYPAINDGDFAPLPVPLPPLSEQHRIVAKVDELMLLCDELEAKQAKRERRRDRLVAATLHGLNNGDVNNLSFPLVGNPSEERLWASRSDITFEGSARFYFNHLPRLTTRTEHIHQLRQTILNLAVRGKLVLQDSKNEHARDLLKRLEAEKALLVKDGHTKAKEFLPVVELDEVSFRLPTSWQWVRLGNLLELIKNGFNGKPNKTNGRYKVTRIETISYETIDLGRVGFIDDLPEDVAIKHAIKYGDILFSHINSEPHLGKTAICIQDEPALIHGVNLLLLRALKQVNPFFLDIVIRQLRTAGYFVSIAQRAVNQSSINQKNLWNTPVPLPPLAEQHRIVAKVDALMVLCDELESRITTNATTRHQFLNATMHEALNGCTQAA